MPSKVLPPAPTNAWKGTRLSRTLLDSPPQQQVGVSGHGVVRLGKTPVCNHRTPEGPASFVVAEGFVAVGPASKVAVEAGVVEVDSEGRFAVEYTKADG